jgi:hypothetical protein
MSVDKQMLQRAAATTWEVLSPEVVTLVAVDDDTLEAPGHHLPRVVCPANPAKTPYVKGLFQHANAKAVQLGARFAGFTNGDIAYDKSLIEVLRSIALDIDNGVLGKRVLVVGQRLNIARAVEDAVTLTFISQHSTIDKALPGSEVHKSRRDLVTEAILNISHKKDNHWMTSLAEDYFFFTPGTFDFNTIPNYVIGRVGYDSFVTQWALDNGVEVIDASQYLHAAHLTGSDGNAAGWNTKRYDKSWNYCALHAICSSAESAWQPFCQSCFRCKLGGTHQAKWRLIARDNAKYNQDGRAQNSFNDDMPMLTVKRREWKPNAKERAEYQASTLHRTKHVLWWFGVPNETAAAFIDAVKDVDAQCDFQGNCCSFRGASAVEYELGQRWQIRGEWPVDGMFNTSKLNMLWEP